jgi:hypothetical protein
MYPTATKTGFQQRVLVWAEIALAIGSVAPILGMPIIVGALQDGWGYTAVLLLAGSTSALAAATYAVVHGRYRKESVIATISLEQAE